MQSFLAKCDLIEFFCRNLIQSEPQKHPLINLFYHGQWQQQPLSEAEGQVEEMKASDIASV